MSKNGIAKSSKHKRIERKKQLLEEAEPQQKPNNTNAESYRSLFSFPGQETEGHCLRVETEAEIMERGRGEKGVRSHNVVKSSSSFVIYVCFVSSRTVARGSPGRNMLVERVLHLNAVLVSLVGTCRHHAGVKLVYRIWVGLLLGSKDLVFPSETLHQER